MKKLIGMMLAVVLAFSILPMHNAYAEEIEMKDCDYSFLTEPGALIDQANSQTRGVYLVSGMASINKYSSNKIVAGGDTTAAMYCKVSLTVIPEKLTSSGWTKITSWTASRSSDVIVMSSKILTVATGYKYRVRCIHKAESDTHYTYTDALKM